MAREFLARSALGADDGNVHAISGNVRKRTELLVRKQTVTWLWPQDRVDRFLGFWRSGLSASRIAAQMDDGATRNAIIGLARRLGLTDADRGGKPKAEQGLRPKHGTAAAPKPAPAPVRKPKPVPAIEPFAAAPRTAADIADLPTIMTVHHQGQCKYGIEGLGLALRMCGERTGPGSSWCPACRAIVFVPARARTMKSERGEAA